MAAKAQPPNLLNHCVGSAVGFWGVWTTSPLVVASEPQWLPIACGATAIFFAKKPLCYGLLQAARCVDWVSAHKPTGLQGTERWGTFSDLKPLLNKKHKGPFWGMLSDRKWRKTPLFIPYETVAVTLGPSGTGKSTRVLVPMALSIRGPKVYSDFKGDLSVLLKKPLEALGERVIIINPAGKWIDRLGETDCYNPVDIVTDNCYTPGKLEDISDDLREIAGKLLQEPSDSTTDDTFWREGGRGSITIALVILIIIDGYGANLPEAAKLLQDKEQLEYHLRWIVGVNLDGSPKSNGPLPIHKAEWAKYHSEDALNDFISWVRIAAKYWLGLMTSDNKNNTFESFISGAQQKLAKYSYGRLAKVVSKSTFSMNDIRSREQATNLFIIPDNSRLESYREWLGLMQWAVMSAIKRHPNQDVVVYFQLDEINNYYVENLEDFFSWCRGQNVRIHTYLQSNSGFKKRYSKEALEMLFSEAQIIQILAGQSSPEVLKFISEELLGEQSVKQANLSKTDDEKGLHENVSEVARILLKPGELRRLKQGILMVDGEPAVLTDNPFYSEIEPFRKWVDTDPIWKKPWLLPVKLRLKVPKS